MITRFQVFTIICLLLLAVAIGGLFYYFDSVKSTSVAVVPTVAESPTETIIANKDSQEEITQLQASISALLTRVETLEDQPTKLSSAPVASTSRSTSPLRKETLYLGSANTTSRKWTDTDVEVVINSNDYPANTTVVYEAGLSIIGGEAWSRVVNKSTGAVISASEVSHNDNMLTWKNSSAFKLFPGSNRYTIELRSTSGEVANLSGARLIVSW